MFNCIFCDARFECLISSDNQKKEIYCEVLIKRGDGRAWGEERGEERERREERGESRREEGEKRKEGERTQ